MDSSFVAVAVTGCIAGAVHVVTGLDHMAVLAPLSLGKRWRAAFLGVRWGLGHSLGVGLVALAAVALREYADVQLISGMSERLVGVMLLGVGAWSIRRALRMRLHTHTHTHDDATHTHLHVHPTDGHDPAPHVDGLITTDIVADHANNHLHGHAAVAAGSLHGVAGGAHIFAVLPAVAMPSLLSSLEYLGAFTLGTISAMGAFAALVGMSSAWAHERGGATYAKPLMVAAGGLTVCVGVAWLALPALGYNLP